MDKSYSLSVELKVFGYLVSLIGSYQEDKKIILLTLEASSEEKKNMQTELSEDDKKLLQDNFLMDDGLSNKLDTDSETKLREFVKNSLSRIQIDNVGLYWDKTSKKTYLYVEVKVLLDGLDALSSEDGNFSFEFVSFDFTFTSEKENFETGDFKKEDKKRREALLDLRAEMGEGSGLRKQLEEIQENVKETMQQIEDLKDKIKNNQFELMNVFQSFKDNQEELTNTFQSFKDNQEHQSWIETILNNEKKVENWNPKAILKKIEEGGRSMSKDEVNKLMNEIETL